MIWKDYWLLGQNARNLKYIKWYNDELAKKLADSKIKTKEFLGKRGVTVSDNIMIIANHEELIKVELAKIPLPFVVKPSSWFGGKGIFIIDEIDNLWNFILNDWKILSKKDLFHHMSEILDGFYSISGNRDKVLIEKKIELDKSIELLGKYWLPDIRVIVFNMVPVMAMLRLPTKESKWKANIHAWACGVGIDMNSGRLTYITKHSKVVKSVEWIWDIRWTKLPKWDELLYLAVKIQSATNIWYIWCDMTLDITKWPILLEVNARPGLEVQVANLAPLKDRLKRVEWIYVNTVEKWVRIGKDLFWGNIEEKIKNISWKNILGSKEYISMIYQEKNYKYIADIDPSKETCLIDKSFAWDILSIKDKENIKLSINIFDIKRFINFDLVDLKDSKIILGRNALRWFLIDPYKYKKWDLPIDNSSIGKSSLKNIAITKSHEEQLEKLDKKISNIDRKLVILKYISPINIEQEKLKFVNTDGESDIILKYPEMKLELELMLNEIKWVEVPDIPMSNIFKRKKEEVINKINFLIAFREQDYKKMTIYSKKIYWDVDKKLLEISKQKISEVWAIIKEEEYLTIDEIRKYIKKFNHIYNIKLSTETRTWWSRFAMKWDRILVREWAMVGKKEMRSIIAHEIEGHYLRKINGRNLKYSIFTLWWSNYLEIDEGIAIYSQNRFLWDMDRKSYTIYERYYFLDYALNNSYEKLLNRLLEYYNDLDSVFIYLMRLKRWLIDIKQNGFYTKDLVYLNWYDKIERFLENWWNLKELYLGKISLEDLEDIKSSGMIPMRLEDLRIPFFL